jgi:hypothetical protein
MIREWYTIAKTGVKKIQRRQLGHSLHLSFLAIATVISASGHLLTPAFAAPADEMTYPISGLKFTARLRGEFGEIVQIHQAQARLNALSQRPLQLGPTTRLKLASIAPDQSNIFILVTDPRMTASEQIVGVDTGSSHPLVSIFNMASPQNPQLARPAKPTPLTERGTLELVIEVLAPDDAALPGRPLDYNRWKKWAPLRNWFERRREEKRSIIKVSL